MSPMIVQKLATLASIKRTGPIVTVKREGVVFKVAGGGSGAAHRGEKAPFQHKSAAAAKTTAAQGGDLL